MSAIARMLNYVAAPFVYFGLATILASCVSVENKSDPGVKPEEVMREIDRGVLRLAHHLWVWADPHKKDLHKKRTLGQSYRDLPDEAVRRLIELGFNTDLSCQQLGRHRTTVEYHGNPLPGFRLDTVTAKLKTVSGVGKDVKVQVPVVPFSASFSSTRTNTQELVVKMAVPDPDQLRDKNIELWTSVLENRNDPEAQGLLVDLTSFGDMAEHVLCTIAPLISEGQAAVTLNSLDLSVGFKLSRTSVGPGFKFEVLDISLGGGRKRTDELSSTLVFHVSPIGRNANP